MSNITLENKKTESKISVQTKIMGDDTLYLVKSKKGSFEITCKGDGTLLVTSSAKTMASAIGGRGEDNNKDAWFTDKDCKTNSEAVSNIIELLMTISE